MCGCCDEHGNAGKKSYSRPKTLKLQDFIKDKNVFESLMTDDCSMGEMDAVAVQPSPSSCLHESRSGSQFDLDSLDEYPHLARAPVTLTTRDREARMERRMRMWEEHGMEFKPKNERSEDEMCGVADRGPPAHSHGGQPLQNERSTSARTCGAADHDPPAHSRAGQPLLGATDETNHDDMAATNNKTHSLQTVSGVTGAMGVPSDEEPSETPISEADLEKVFGPGDTARGGPRRRPSPRPLR